MEEAALRRTDIAAGTGPLCILIPKSHSCKALIKALLGQAVVAMGSVMKSLVRADQEPKSSIRFSRLIQSDDASAVRFSDIVLISEKERNHGSIVIRYVAYGFEPAFLPSDLEPYSPAHLARLGPRPAQN